MKHFLFIVLLALAAACGSPSHKTEAPKLGATTRVETITAPVSNSQLFVWQKLLDIDFTALANQDLTAAGTYTFGTTSSGTSLTNWSRVNNATDFRIVNGSGLKMRLQGGSTGVNFNQNQTTAPYVMLPLTNYISGVDITTRFRGRMLINTSGEVHVTAGNERIYVGVGNGVPNASIGSAGSTTGTGNSDPVFIGMKRAYVAGSSNLGYAAVYQSLNNFENQGTIGAAGAFGTNDYLFAFDSWQGWGELLNCVNVFRGPTSAYADTTYANLFPVASAFWQTATAGSAFINFGNFRTPNLIIGIEDTFNAANDTTIFLSKVRLDYMLPAQQ